MLISKKDRASLVKSVFKKWRIGISLSIAIVLLVSSFLIGYLYHRSGNSLGPLHGWITSPLSTMSNYATGWLGPRPEQIVIDVKQNDFQRIAYKRLEAIQRGFLRESPDDWVPGKIRYNNENYDVRIRLKGDLEDHWKYDDHWSYKFEVKGGKTILGMRRFAIQHPRTRGYLNEWILHKLLEHCRLISLRYDFIDVTINGKEQSIYAVEENFDKLLVERNDLREGPIFRFESNYMVHNVQQEVLPRFQGSAITPYGLGKIERDQLLAGQFSIALSLIESFRQNKLRASQVFDSEKLALFFAIIDLMGHKHATLLDNIRFYYNPITSLIEPIGYDNQGMMLLDAQSVHTIEGANKRLDLDKEQFNDSGDWFAPLFMDATFFKDYVRALEKISDTKFLDSFFESIREEYREKLGILHRSYPWYEFDGESILYNNQRFIGNILNPVKSLRIYYDSFSRAENTLSLNLLNIHALPAEILGLSLGDSVFIEPAQNTVIQASSDSEPLNYVRVRFRLPKDYGWSDNSISDLKLQYLVLGTNRVRSEEITPWRQLSAGFSNNDPVRQKPNHREFKFLAVNESAKEIIVRPGSWNIDRNLVVPGGYVLVCHEGTRLNLLRRAKIISYSAFKFFGSENSPIEISSSDSTGQGIVVMNADLESVLRHVVFENLSNPSQNGWELTGAVTFYESSVVFSRCRFERQRSEDALNIVRSSFNIDNTIFSSNMYDALDLDFSKGTIVQSSFLESGNDAIDISGSVVDLQAISINHAGDKGLSAGEKSLMNCEGVTIKNAEIAVASKDLSKIIVRDLDMTFCKVGFAAYQKKAEFGPSSIVVNNLTMGDVKVPHLIEKKSSAIIEGQVLEQNSEKVAGILYGVQYGKSSR